MTPPPLSLRALGRRVLVALVVTTVLVVALWVTAWHEVDARVAQIRTVRFPPGMLTEGGNYLFIGSDSRAFVKNKKDAEHFGSAETETGQRSDTLMVAHIDPGGKTGALVSFPRDLWVDLPDHGGNKINAAFAFGGPALVVKTLKREFNIPISHYLEVDFAGFRDIVNAIGTVPVYFPKPARDEYSGLLIGSHGCHRLNGDQALAYVRSRYYEYQEDGEWKSDPLSDLGRINRQQYFVRTLAQAAIQSVVTHPFGALDLADKSVAALTRDKSLGTSDLQKLVRAFRSTDPKAFPMLTVPATNGYRDGQSVLLLDEAAAAPVLTRLRSEDGPKALPDVAPASVRVTVENGSGVSGAAGGALGRLGADGFEVAAPASDADRSDYAVTEVRYAPGSEQKARLVLAYLGGAGKVVPWDAAPTGVDVVVVLGRDFGQVSQPVSLQAAHAAPIAARRPAAGGATTPTGPPANPGGPMPIAGCP
jgi:LCP family protein required for cell wall assembly